MAICFNADLEMTAVGTNITRFGAEMQSRFHLLMVGADGNWFYTLHGRVTSDEIPFTAGASRPVTDFAGRNPVVDQGWRGWATVGVDGNDPRRMQYGTNYVGSPYVMLQRDGSWQPWPAGDVSIQGAEGYTVIPLTDPVDGTKRFVSQSERDVFLYEVETGRSAPTSLAKLEDFTLIDAFHHGQDVVVLASPKSVDYPFQIVESDELSEAFRFWQYVTFAFVLNEDEDYAVFNSFSSSNSSAIPAVGLAGRELYTSGGELNGDLLAVTDVVWDGQSSMWRQAVSVCNRNGEWNFLGNNPFPFSIEMSLSTRCGVSWHVSNRLFAYAVVDGEMYVSYFDFSDARWKPWRENPVCITDPPVPPTPSSSSSSSLNGSASSSSSFSSNSSGFPPPCIWDFPPVTEEPPPVVYSECSLCYFEFTYQTFYVKDRLLVVSSDGDDLLYVDGCTGPVVGKLLYDTGCIGTELIYDGPHTVYIGVTPEDFPISVELIPRCDGDTRITYWWVKATGCGVSLDDSGSNRCKNWIIPNPKINNNKAPVADAGPDQTVPYVVSSPGVATAVMAGDYYDVDELIGPNSLVGWWRHKSGNGTVTFVDYEDKNTVVYFTDVNFSGPSEDFVLQLVAWDGMLYDTDEMTVTVERECVPCCQCWRLTATLGSYSGCEEATGTLSANECICTVPTTTIDLCDGAVKKAEVTIDFMKTTYDRIVARLTYDDTCCGGATTEQSWYEYDAAVSSPCDNAVAISVEMPSVGTISITSEACTGESCSCS